MVTATTIIAGTVMAPTPTRNATPDTPPNTTQPAPADTSTTHSPSRRDAQHFTDPTPPIATTAPDGTGLPADSPPAPIVRLCTNYENYFLIN